MTKYFFISGEVSGDMHAARLICSLRTEYPDTCFVGLGGDHMQAAGCRLVRHISDMAFMGVADVLMHLDKVIKNIRVAKQALLEENPDVLVLVDYPTFNLKIAAWCRRVLPETKIVYYIPPKVWAWKTWRVHRIARLCDRILCIFPFEVEFYRSYGYKAEYVGNPTMETVDSVRQFERVCKTPYIAVLPGSRRHEITRCLPRMLEAALRQTGYEVVVAGISTVDRSLYMKVIDDCKDPARVNIVFDKTFDVLRYASVAVVNSGTATLETALIGTPQTAVYQLYVGPLLYTLRSLVFKIPFFTLVNIIAGREVIKEWLAYRFTVGNVAADLHDILTNTARRQQMLTDYSDIRKALQG